MIVLNRIAKQRQQEGLLEHSSGLRVGLKTPWVLG